MLLARLFAILFESSNFSSHSSNWSSHFLKEWLHRLAANLRFATRLRRGFLRKQQIGDLPGLRPDSWKQSVLCQNLPFTLAQSKSGFSNRISTVLKTGFARGLGPSGRSGRRPDSIGGVLALVGSFCLALVVGPARSKNSFIQLVGASPLLNEFFDLAEDAVILCQPISSASKRWPCKFGFLFQKHQIIGPSIHRPMKCAVNRPNIAVCTTNRWSTFLFQKRWLCRFVVSTALLVQHIVLSMPNCFANTLLFQQRCWLCNLSCPTLQLVGPSQLSWPTVITGQSFCSKKNCPAQTVCPSQLCCPNSLAMLKLHSWTVYWATFCSKKMALQNCPSISFCA